MSGDNICTHGLWQSNCVTCSKLSAFVDLPQNWDTYGAKKISLDAIELARIIAPKLAGYSVVPTSDGGVQFELHKNGKSIEVEIKI